MKTLITAKNFELTKAILDYVEKKFERLTTKVDKDTKIRITLSTSKEGQKAEAMLFVEGSLLKIEVVEDNLYVSIDKLIDKLSYQVNKMLDKSNSKQTKSIRFLETIKNEEEVEEIVEKHPIVVKRKQFDMKPMMEEEAILQMEMLGHSFFFFLNGETNTMCLLYKRKDGNYGLIEGLR